MLAAEVTTRASSDAVFSWLRAAWWRRSSDSLGACDMNTREELFERCDPGFGGEVFSLVPYLIQRSREFGDGSFQPWIVGRQLQSGPILSDGFRPQTAALIDFADRTNGGEILGSALKNQPKLPLGL